MIMVRNNVKQRRAQHGPRGVSQAHLARQVGVSRSYLHRLEQQERQPSAEVMFKIARYFKCGVEEVFFYLPNGSTEP